ncbi:3-deoxy-7-phosphoheptulonate synthase [Ruminococcaceae bacterium OttesenSCG-928-I18]|nr:3-deoxy-7-phosphoheptulonate synthase [Ruminococcaceae bacterium OttesenSCG-928-I18]
MIIVLKTEPDPAEVARMEQDLERRGLSLHAIKGQNTQVIGLVGDTASVDEEALQMYSCVDKVLKVQEPYKLAGRRFHPHDSIVDVAGRKVGGGHFAVIAGPCSVESEEQVLSIANDVKLSGAQFLRGGAFKPRTSPYAFQGLGLDGLELLKIAREKTGLPIVTEIMGQEFVEIFERDVDIIQVGARNMQNFLLLREVGKTGRPILLKRGLSNTIEELLMAAEYVLSSGKSRVILCERGIRTFETATRNTLDLSAVPVLQKKSHLPVIVDPSHGTGHWDLVFPMALAATAAGADGLIIEVHNRPEQALCDGAQSVTPALFDKLMKKLGRLRNVLNEEAQEEVSV